VNDGRREIVICHLEVIWILQQMQYKYRIFMTPLIVTMTITHVIRYGE
jgi:hypothetical protein